jgi:hypothetical protein
MCFDSKFRSAYERAICASPGSEFRNGEHIKRSQVPKLVVLV